MHNCRFFPMHVGSTGNHTKDSILRKVQFNTQLWRLCSAIVRVLPSPLKQTEWRQKQMWLFKSTFHCHFQNNCKLHGKYDMRVSHCEGISGFRLWCNCNLNFLAAYFYFLLKRVSQIKPLYSENPILAKIALLHEEILAVSPQVLHKKEGHKQLWILFYFYLLSLCECLDLLNILLSFFIQSVLIIFFLILNSSHIARIPLTTCSFFLKKGNKKEIVKKKIKRGKNRQR